MEIMTPEMKQCLDDVVAAHTNMSRMRLAEYTRFNIGEYIDDQAWEYYQKKWYELWPPR